MSGEDEEACEEGAGGAGTQRLDKWLWFARVVKTRTLAAGLVTDGRVRVNRERIVKPAHAVRAGDVVTVTVGPRVRVLEVRAPGTRRGSPAEAQAIYRELGEPKPAKTGGGASPAAAPAPREAGTGRPTKRDRRLTDRLKGDEG
jgi:ribosome-associated heat shock protein Hsp15